MATFDSVDLSKLKSVLDKPANFDVIQDFVEGDHYQKGKGFIGPSESGTEDTSSLIIGSIERSFTAEDLIGEIIERRVDGVLSKLPTFTVQPRRRLDEDAKLEDAEEERIEEQQVALRDWFDECRIYDVLHEFGMALSAYRRASLRIRVPRARLDNDGGLVMTPGSPTEALGHIFVECVLPTNARVYRDQDSMYDLGIVWTEINADKLNNERKEYLELSYLLPESTTSVQIGGTQRVRPMTRMRIAEIAEGIEGATATSDVGVDLDLNGNLMLFEAEERRAFITDQIIQNQKALNTASTELRIVNDDEGFRIRLLLNAMPPGKVEIDPDTGEHVFTPSENFRLGRGALAFFQGTEVMDEEGNLKDVKTPTATSLDAGNPSNYTQEMDRRRRAILNAAHQIHVEIFDDATSSGESRVQALFDYLLNVNYLKRTIDKAGTWLMETAWALALHFASSPGRDNDLRVDFSTNINIPYLPGNLIAALIALKDTGARSVETLMRDTGIDDIEGEMQRIERAKDEEPEPIEPPTLPGGNPPENNPDPSGEQEPGLV